MSSPTNHSFTFSSFTDKDNTILKTKASELNRVKVKNTVLAKLLDLSFTGKLLVMGNAHAFQITIDKRHTFKISHRIKDDLAFYRISMQNLSSFTTEEATLLVNVGKALISGTYDAKKPFYLEAKQCWQIKRLWMTMKQLNMTMLATDNEQKRQFATFEQEYRDNQSIRNTFHIDVDHKNEHHHRSATPSTLHEQTRESTLVSLLFTEKLTDKVFTFFELGDTLEIEAHGDRWQLHIDGVPMDVINLGHDFLQFSGLGDISDKNIGAKEKLTKLLNLIDSFNRKSRKRLSKTGFSAAEEKFPSLADPQP